MLPQILPRHHTLPVAAGPFPDRCLAAQNPPLAGTTDTTQHINETLGPTPPVSFSANARLADHHGSHSVPNLEANPSNSSVQSSGSICDLPDPSNLCADSHFPLSAVSHGHLPLARTAWANQDVTMDDSVTWNYDKPVYDQQRGRWYYEGRRSGALSRLCYLVFSLT